MERLAAGIHPMTQEVLPETGRSWLGLLLDRAPDKEEESVTVEGRMSRDVAAAAAHDFRFLTGHLPKKDIKFDEWLASFFQVVIGAAPAAPGSLTLWDNSAR